MKKIDYSIVVPVYRSKESLKILTQRVYELFNTKLQDKSFELIFVNDSPFDSSTCEVLKDLYTQYKFIKVEIYTTRESERLLRLPMYYGIKDNEINKIFEVVSEFFRKQ